MFLNNQARSALAAAVDEGVGNDADTKLLMTFNWAAAGSSNAKTIFDVSAGASAGQHPCVNTGDTEPGDKVTLDPSPPAGNEAWGPCGVFDANSHIQIPNHADFLFGADDWSVDLRLNWNVASLATIPQRYIAGITNTSAPADSMWYVRANSNRLIFGVYQDNSTVYTVQSDTFAVMSGGDDAWAGQWHHVACQREGSNIYIWVDGTRYGPTSIGAITLNAPSFDLGVGTFGELADSGHRYIGLLDEFRIQAGINFSGPTIQVPAEPYGPAPAPAGNTADTVLLIHLDAPQAAPIADYYRDVAAGGSAPHTIDPGGSAAFTLVGQRKGLNQSHAHDGTDARFRVTSGLADFAFGTGDFVVDLWINPNTTAGTQDLANALNGVGTTGWRLWLNGSTPTWSFGGTSVLGAGTVTTSAWHHIAVSRSGGTLRMYLDGAQVGANTPDANSYAQPTTVNFGVNESNGNGFNGEIDEVRVVKGGSQAYSSIPLYPYGPDAR